MDKKVNEKKRLREIILELGAVLIIVHIFAVFYEWYHIYPWIDIPQHFAGGILAVLIFYWITHAHPRFFKLVPGSPVPVILVLSWTALVGLLFELAEFTYDILVFGYLNLSRFPSQLGLTDTMVDLIFDLLGGLALAILMRLRYDKRKHQL